MIAMQALIDVRQRCEHAEEACKLLKDASDSGDRENAIDAMRHARAARQSIERWIARRVVAGQGT